VAEPEKAVFRIVIDGDQEAIFRELTKTDSPQGAVFGAVLTLSSTGLAPGKKMQMRTVSGKHVIVVGEVVEYDPPRRFVHTHKFSQYDDPVCKVIYDLKPVKGGVEVTLTVENMVPGTKTANDMRKGGMFILNNLRSIVEKGRPPIGARVMYRLFASLEFVLSKKTLTANWPLE
jgi:uncharacterized protein YndB with AHSA1/START domain